MNTAWSKAVWIAFFLVTAGCLLGVAQVSDPPTGMHVTRSISTGHALPGSIFRVTLRVQASEDLLGVGLRETLPLGWRVHPVDNAGASFHGTHAEWVFAEVIPAGVTRFVTYDVSVPAANALYADTLPHCFTIDGTYQATVPAVKRAIEGESQVEISSFLAIPTVIAHLVPGEETGADRVDLRLSRTIDSAQLTRALEYWANDFVVPNTGGATIDHLMMGRLIAYHETCTRVDDDLPRSIDPQIEATRTIETLLPCDSVLFPEGCHDPGEDAREVFVRVEMTFNHDAYGVALKEWLPTEWRIAPVEHKGFWYRPSAAEWVFPGRVRAGDTLIVVYRADVVATQADAVLVDRGCCGHPVVLAGEASSALACSVARVGGEDTVTMMSCVPVILAISRWDVSEDRFDAGLSNLVEFPQVQRAVQFWKDHLPVPHTCGYTVGYETLKRIVSYWQTATPVTEPLPEEALSLCDGDPRGCRTGHCIDGWLCLMLDTQNPDDRVGLPEPPEVVVDAGPDREIDCRRPAVLLAAEARGAVEPYRFEWIGPSGTTLGHEPTLWVNQAGEYTVVAISCGGCMAETTVTVTSDFAVPQVAASVDDVLTGHVLEVELLAEVEGGTPPFHTEWIGPCAHVVGQGHAIRVREPGEYMVVVTGANGCSSQDTVRVLQDIEPPSAHIEVLPEVALLEGEFTLTCDVQEITLTSSVSGGRSPYTLVWADAQGETLGDQEALAVVTPGTYTLTVIGANGVSDSVTVVVLQDLSEPSVCAMVSGDLTCAVSEVTLSVQVVGGRGPFSVVWVDEAGSQVGNSESVEVSEPGEYTVAVTGANGCRGTAMIQVRQDTEPPGISLSGDRVLTCVQPTVELTVSVSGGRPPYEIMWLDACGEVVGEEKTLAVSSPGAFTVMVVGANGCHAEESVVVVEDVEAPRVHATVDGPLTCGRREVQLHANIAGGRPPLSVVWTNERGATVGTSVLVAVREIGTYTVTVTGGNGCSDTDQVTVTEDMAAPVASVDVDGLLTCAHPERTLVANVSGGRPPYTMEWRHPAGHALGCQPTQTVTDPGMYALTVWGANECSTTVTIVVQQDVEGPEVKAFVSGPITCAAPTVELTACPTGGRAPYAYRWTDPEGRVAGETADIEVSEAGEYRVTVTGANGCQGTAVVAVVEDLCPPSIAMPDTLTLTCLVPVVTVDPLIHAGRAPYVYRWTEACGTVIASTARVNLDFPGTYTLTVTGSNGCSSAAQVVVLDGVDAPVVDAGPDRTLACLGDEVVLTASVVGGKAPYQYSWVNSRNEVVGTCGDVTVMRPGTYILTVIAADGCVGVDTVSVFAPEP